MYIHILQQTFVYIFDIRSIATTALYSPLGNLGILDDLFDFRKREDRPVWVKPSDREDFDL